MTARLRTQAGGSEYWSSPAPLALMAISRIMSPLVQRRASPRLSCIALEAYFYDECRWPVADCHRSRSPALPVASDLHEGLALHDRQLPDRRWPDVLPLPGTSRDR